MTTKNKEPSKIAPPFFFLQRFRAVVVCGPQRSGTTIATNMIAADCNFKAIDEEDYGTKDLKAWKEIVTLGRRVVIHSPAMTRYIIEVIDKTVAVIFMIRDTSEIAASVKRINWQRESEERAKYSAQKDERPLPVVKLDYWRKEQAPHIDHAYELNYHDLSKHRLWLPKNMRKGFAPRQWQEVGNNRWRCPPL